MTPEQLKAACLAMPGSEETFPFGVLNHGEGDTVLNRTGWVLSLQFHVEFAWAGVEAGNLDEGGVADQIENGMCHRTFGLLSFRYSAGRGNPEGIIRGSRG